MASKWVLGLSAIFFVQAGHAVDFEKEIDLLVAKQMAAQKIPGMSVAVLHLGQPVWAKGYGYSDVENLVPTKTVTVFRLASVSKPITATAVMQLTERGKIQLDEPIQTYCPAFPEKPWRLTARHLLGHLGGVRHYNESEWPSSTKHYSNLVEPLAIFKMDPLLFEPGTQYRYTTYGYNVLGCAVEGASAMPFVDYLAANVFAPAGMEQAGADDAHAIIPHRAQGYQLGADGVLRNSALADTSNKIPGGGLRATATDLVRYAGALFSRKLLGQSSLEQSFTVQKLKDGKATHYGLGWGIGSWKKHKEVAHTGGQERVSTILYMIPGEAFAVALLSNLQSSELTPLARDIAEKAAGL